MNQIINIARNRFNTQEFFREGALISSGLEYNWSILNNETDARSTALTELDLSKVQFVEMLKDSESYIEGEEKLKHLKESGYIRLDADIFLTLLENQHLIPESWKKVNGKTLFIRFHGTVLNRDSNGSRYVLFLYWKDWGFWNENGRWTDRHAWRWGVSWLHHPDSNPSAVLNDIIKEVGE